MRVQILAIALCMMISGPATARDPDKLGPSTASPADHTFERAGLPSNVSRLAIPSVEKHEGPGYIGGGRLIRGDSRGPADGTFGFDYQGLGWHPGRVFLGWAHDRSHQPKLGSYKTDTYHVPDIFSFHPLRRVFDENKAK